MFFLKPLGSAGGQDAGLPLACRGLAPHADWLLREASQEEHRNINQLTISLAANQPSPAVYPQPLRQLFLILRGWSVGFGGQTRHTLRTTILGRPTQLDGPEPGMELRLEEGLGLGAGLGVGLGLRP